LAIALGLDRGPAGAGAVALRLAPEVIKDPVFCVTVSLSDKRELSHFI